jgi:hypothetical protein
MKDNWEIILPFDGDLADEKIVCQNCHWSWYLKDGGNDPYVCHKCFFDNYKLEVYNFEGNSTFVGTDWGKVISSGLEISSKYIPPTGSRLNEDAKQGIAYKRESEALRKKIKAECRSKPILGKKKKDKWEKCKNDVVVRFEKRVEQDSGSRLNQKDLIQKNILQEQEQKQKRNQTYIVIGSVFLLFLGFVLYKKMNK